MSVHDSAARLEDDSLGVHRRRVDTVLGVDVADVVGAEGEVGNVKRPAGVFVDVDEVPVIDAQQVDLEGKDRESRLLPSVVLDRRRVGGLLSQLRQVDMDPRLVEEEVRDDVAGENLTPLHACVKPGKESHGRIGMRLLEDVDVGESDRKGEETEVKTR